ncbi:MAG: hypothetical protein J0H51_07510, partial [Rhizobiales bacterium]|nr:hypothetical protein [Hyphomicrobiales bacterium]
MSSRWCSASRCTRSSPESCKIEYEVNAEVGWKIAQLGSRLINGVASKTADQFFNNFAE